METTPGVTRSRLRFIRQPSSTWAATRIALALLLFVASFTKAVEVTGSAPNADFWSQATPWVGAVEFAGALALLAVGHLWPRTTWAAMVIVFSGFASVAAGTAASGSATCGCLGSLSPHPLMMLAIDAGALLFIHLGTPSSVPLLTRRRIYAIAGTFAFVIAAGVAVGTASGPLAGELVDSAFQDRLAEDIRLEMGAVVVRVDRIRHNFSSIPCDSTASTAFTLTNDGAEPVTIGIPYASCGCTTAAIRTQVLPPGESTAIPVKITPSSAGRFHHTVTLPLKDSASNIVRPLIFDVVGTAFWPLASTPRSLIMDRPSDSQMGTYWLTITAQRDEALDELRVAVEGFPASAEIVAIDEQNPKIRRVRILVDWSCQSGGDRLGQLHIRSADNVRELLTVPLRLRSPVYARVIPETLAFGLVDIGETVEQFTDIISVKDAPIRVEITDTPSDVRVAILEHGKTGARISIAPTFNQSGPWQARIGLSITSKGHSTHTYIECAALVR